MTSLDDAFARLHLDEAQREYVEALAAETSDRSELEEVVLGLLEEPDAADAAPAVSDLLDQLDRRKEEAAASSAAVASKPTLIKSIVRPTTPEPAGAKPTRELTDEEKAQRARLLKAYGDVEDEGDDAASAPALAPAGITARPSKPGKSKEKDSDDLLAFRNTNSSDVKAAEAAKRADAAKVSAAKKEKDKKDLEKQRADQIKRKEQARAKAARSERKG